MREIASIVELVLSDTRPESQGGSVSKKDLRLDESTRGEAERRVRSLLRDFRVYPALDADILFDLLVEQPQYA